MISFALLMTFCGCIFATLPLVSITCWLVAIACAFVAAHWQRRPNRAAGALLLACAASAFVLVRVMLPDVGNFQAGDYGGFAILVAAMLFGGVLGYSISHVTALERRVKRPQLGHHEIAKRVRLWKDTKGNMRLQVIGR